MTTPNNPIDPIIGEIAQAFEGGLYHLALAITLTLPDVCAALEDENGVTTGEKYRAWYRANLAPEYPDLTDEDCWSLRCGVVHQGKCGRPGMQYDRIVFTTTGRFHRNLSGNKGETVYQLDLELFYKDMVAAVTEWWAKSHNLPNVQKNIAGIIRLRPEGLPPHFGMPVIA